MQKSITSISGSSSSGQVGSGEGGGVGGFLEAFKAAMADGQISETEGKDLMEMMKDLLAQATGTKDDAADKASGVEDKKTGADIGLQQDILKMLMGALDDGDKSKDKDKAKAA
jgi:hypothetical protein